MGMSGEDQEIALFLQVLSPLSIKPEQQTAANFLLARSGVHGCAMRTSLSSADEGGILAPAPTAVEWEHLSATCSQPICHLRSNIQTAAAECIK